jgi:hypothetical protein
MALIRRHWKLAIFNAILIVSIVITVLCYIERLGSLPAKAATAGGSGSTTAITLDSTDYARMFQLRNALCLTDVDLAAMGCSQSQASNILSSLASWYQSNVGAWNTIVQQTQSANQQTQQALSSINGAGNTQIWQQMYAAQDQRDSAADSLSQLMQGAASVVAPLLTAQQQSVWTTAQTNVAEGVPPQFRFAPSITPGQAYALFVAVSNQQANPSSLLNSTQQQGLQSVLQSETQNAPTMISTDLAVLPLPTSTSSGQSQSPN